MSAGYSRTALAKKLGIKAGHHVLLVGAPLELEDRLEPLPSGARLTRIGTTEPRAAGEGAELRLDAVDVPRERFDVVLLFCPDASTLGEHFPPTVSRIRWDGGLWACWPKKSSPLYVDLAREEVREVGLGTGLVDNKVCAVDEDWSGLRFVVRKEDRPPGIDEGGPRSP